MNCGLRYDRKETEKGVNSSGASNTPKSGRRERWAAGFFTFLLVSVFAWRVSTLWSQDWQGVTSGSTRSHWEQMRGNDGKFWKGSPDESEYADMEGVRLVGYRQYFYDRQGRLSRVNIFRHHDYYEDVWVLSDEETCEYDHQGRISSRQAVRGNEQWNYEYTDSGYTVSRTGYSNDSRPDIYTYDLAGNLIYFRNATNYRYAHSTTFAYDGKNRLVRQILEVEGSSPYVTLTIEYDEENHTSVETEYDSNGGALYIWYHSYDENWEKTDSVWYAVKDIPGSQTPEEFADYFTKGYWAYHSGGVRMAEMSNEPWNESRNNSKYTAYDYDIHGNCIMEFNVYGVGFVYMTRYVYDGQDRLTEEFEYNFSDVTFWERQQADGNMLTLQVGEDGIMRVTRTAPEGALVNQFVYGEKEVEMQYTPSDAVCWQLSPAQLLAQGEPEITPDEGTVEEPDSSAEQDAFSYVIRPGDCLWNIAEQFLGAGWKYLEIYRQNREVIGDDPGLILPDSRIQISF